MTRHFVNTKQVNKNVEVLIGWDSPLQRFFLVVQTPDEEFDDEDDDYIYSNLLDDQLSQNPIHYADLGYFKRVLETLQIIIPENIWKELLEDKRLDLKNKEVYWNPDGTKKETE